WLRDKRMRVQRFFHWDRALKVGHRAERYVGAIEKNLDGAGLHAGALQHIREADAAPAAIAGSAGCPLQSGDWRIVECASVSRTLENPYQFIRRHLAKIIQSEGEWHLHVPLDLQSPIRNVDLRY